MLNQSQKKSKLLALTRAKLRSMHSELSYGLSFAPKLQRVGVIHISGSDQPTPDPSFSQVSEDEGVVSFACYSGGGDGNDARDGAGVGDACAGVRVQRQQSPAVFASPKRGLYLMKYRSRSPNKSIIRAS